MKKINLLLAGIAFLYCSSSITFAQNISESANLFNEIDNSLKELNIEMMTCRSAARIDFQPRQIYANSYMGMRLAIVSAE